VIKSAKISSRWEVFGEMALEAILAVEQAEQQASRVKAEAAQKAKDIASAAEAEGQAAVKEASERAAAELWKLADKAKEESAAESEKIREAVQEEINALRSQAESRLEKAADRIVERIVNG
jgi:V/A-type H+/Na+-transporting ATPase subunit G/H